MGASSYRERHALQLHQRINAEIERDPFDQDYDPSEVPSKPVDRDSETFRPARPPKTDGAAPADVARRWLQLAKQSIKAQEPARNADDGRAALQHIRCWHDTPELYRKHIARMAGLDADVVGKLDRDLTEREKALLRAAIRDFLTFCNALVNL